VRITISSDTQMLIDLTQWIVILVLLLTKKDK